jgi:hypothetical protein
MTKQTKMLVGVGLVGVAAYLLWKSQQPKATTTTSFVGNNSKVFKGDKSFVGDNSKVFKGDK